MNGHDNRALTEIKRLGDAISGINIDLSPVTDVVNETSTSLKQSMSQMVQDVDTEVTQMSQSVQSAPSGIMAARMLYLDAQAVSGGVQLKYKTNVGVGLNGLEAGVDGTYDFPLANVTKGVMVRYKTGGYPKNKEDGTLAFTDDDVLEVRSTSKLMPKEKIKTVSGLSGNTLYYFSAFPYTTQGIYNEQIGRTSSVACESNTAKGAVRVSVSANTTVKPIGAYTITIRPASGGAVTRQVTGENDTIVTGLATGNCTVTITAIGGFQTPAQQAVQIVAGRTAEVNMQYVLSLAGASWSDIDMICKAGKAQELFEIGETKNITVGKETVTLVIEDFYHDDLASGGKAPITFGMKDMLATLRRMNASNTNAGGFTGSEMYKWLNNQFYNSLPADLKAVIKSVNKKTSAGNSTATMNTNAMKVWLFSENEVGLSQYSVSGEGYAYPRYTTNGSRIKKQNNGAGGAIYWWLRSPLAGDSTRFCNVNNDGTANANGASGTYGVSCGFCL